MCTSKAVITPIKLFDLFSLGILMQDVKEVSMAAETEKIANHCHKTGLGFFANTHSTMRESLSELLC